MARVGCGGAAGAPPLAHSRHLGRRRRGAPAADLPPRLPQLRHDLRAGLGAGTGAWDEPGLRRRPAPHPTPARRPAGTGDDAARRRRDRRDDGRRLPFAGTGRLLRLPARLALVRPAHPRRPRPDPPPPPAPPPPRPAAPPPPPF